MNDVSLDYITKVAARAALRDFEKLVHRYINFEIVDVAIVSAVQIHGQYQDYGKAQEIKYDTDFVALQKGIAVVGGGEPVEIRKDPDQLCLEIDGRWLQRRPDT